MHQDQKQIVNEVLTGMSEVQGENVVVMSSQAVLPASQKYHFKLVAKGIPHSSIGPPVLLV